MKRGGFVETFLPVPHVPFLFKSEFFGRKESGQKKERKKKERKKKKKTFPTCPSLGLEAKSCKRQILSQCGGTTSMSSRGGINCQVWGRRSITFQ